MVYAQHKFFRNSRPEMFCKHLFLQNSSGGCFWFFSFATHCCMLALTHPFLKKLSNFLYTPRDLKNHFFKLRISSSAQLLILTMIYSIPLFPLYWFILEYYICSFLFLFFNFYFSSLFFWFNPGAITYKLFMAPCDSIFKL